MKNNAHRNVHPFPARMAPEIAIQGLKDLVPGETILDPMVGSGTVLHHAAQHGLRTLGFDLDPLAILMSKVRTSKINLGMFDTLSTRVLEEFKLTKLNDISLPWMDDIETKDFVKFWFAAKQSNALKKLSFLLHSLQQEYVDSVEVDALRLALSRIIITKKTGASLAWDISHSRPHKVKEENDYDVLLGYKSSIQVIRNLVGYNEKFCINSSITLGDARDLKIPSNSVDKVITSPPYLNAIDYMRGHKFSLIWLGHSIPQLRAIRAKAVGVEKNISSDAIDQTIDKIYNNILEKASLKERQIGMIKRYIKDSIDLMAEISRVLKTGKNATLVIGNSNLNSQNIENSEIFKSAAILSGLATVKESTRDIPLTKRYLPISNSGNLSKRMKHEVVLTFLKTTVS